MTNFSSIIDGQQMTGPEVEKRGDEESIQEVTPLREQAVIEKMQMEEEIETTPSTPKNIEIDSKLAWLVAISCSWVMFWSLLVNRSNSLLYISLKKELNMTSEESAAPFSMIGAVSNLFAIFSGILIRRVPLFWTSFMGSLLSAVGVILAATVYNKLAITYAIGIITAIGQSLIFSTNMVAVNLYFKKNRSTASGLSYIGGSLVSFFLPFIYEALEKRMGFRFVLLLIGVLSLNALFGAIILRYHPVEGQDDSVHDLTPKALPSIAIVQNQTIAERLAFMKRPMFYLIVMSGIVFAYVLVLFNITSIDFAIQKGLSRHQASLTLWFYAGGDLIGRLFSGQLSDRGWIKRRSVMCLGFFLSSLAVFGLALTNQKIVFFSLCSLYGLSAGSTLILFSVLIADYLGLANLPLAIGVHCLLNGLASLPRQRLIKYFSEGSEMSYQPMYLFFAIISIGTCICWGIHCLYLHVAERKTKPCQTSDVELKGEKLPPTENTPSQVSSATTP